MNLLSLIPSKDQIQSGLAIDIQNFDGVFSQIEILIASDANQAYRKDYQQLQNARSIIQSLDRLQDPEGYKSQMIWMHDQCVALAQKLDPNVPTSSFSKDEEDWSWLFEEHVTLTPMMLLKFVPFMQAEFEHEDQTLKRVEKMEEILTFFNQNPPFDAQSKEEQKEILHAIRSEMRLHMAEKTIKIGPSTSSNNLDVFWMEAQKEMTLWYEGKKQNKKDFTKEEFAKIWGKLGEQFWGMIKE